MSAFLSWTNKAGVAKTWYFDVVKEIEIEQSSSISEHPIEDGANVADHVRRELDRITMDVFVTQTPIVDRNGRGGRVESVPIKPPKFNPPLAPTPGSLFSAAGNAIKSLIGGGERDCAATVLKFPNEFDAVKDTTDLLEQIRADVQLVSIVTASKVYKDMYLERMSVIGNAGTGTGRELRLSFKEMRKVNVRLVNAPIPAEVRGHIMKPKGQVAPIEVTDPRQKSFAKAGADRIRGRR